MPPWLDSLVVATDYGFERARNGGYFTGHRMGNAKSEAPRMIAQAKPPGGEARLTGAGQSRLARASKTLRMRCAAALLTLVGVPFASAAEAAIAFRHPGALNTSASLDGIRHRISQGQEPWTSALIEVERKAAAPGPALSVIDASDPAQAASSKSESVKAYANALAWRLTGNRTYALQAIAILNRWAAFQGFVGTTDQDKLHAGWIGALFGEAAEIMRTSSDWRSQDVAALQAMFRRAFYPQLITPSRWNGNVDLTQIEALMTLAVFNDDKVQFDRGLERLDARVQSYIYLGSVSGIPSIDGDGGNIVAFWFHPSTWVDGLTQESCRDNGHHAQFGLASALHAAEIAWNQGIDVYTPQKARYTAALELMARQLLTGDMQGTCPNPTATRNVFDTFEVGFNHYNRRMGMPLPFTERLIADRVRPHGISELNIFHETLTHAFAP